MTNFAGELKSETGFRLGSSDKQFHTAKVRKRSRNMLASKHRAVRKVEEHAGQTQSRLQDLKFGYLLAL